MSVSQLKAELAARGVACEGMLERAELERAMRETAPTARPGPPPRSDAEADALAKEDLARLMEAMQRLGPRANGEPVPFEELIGKEATERIAAAQAREKARSGGGGGGGGGCGAAQSKRVSIMTGGGMVSAEHDLDEPLTRAELLDLCARTGRPATTPGDAVTYGMLSMRLAAALGGSNDKARAVVGLVKQLQENKSGGPPAGFFLDMLFGGAYEGMDARFTDYMRKAMARYPKSK